jgi:hypothetical protein
VTECSDRAVSHGTPPHARGAIRRAAEELVLRHLLLRKQTRRLPRRSTAAGSGTAAGVRSVPAVGEADSVQAGVVTSVRDDYIDRQREWLSVLGTIRNNAKHLVLTFSTEFVGRKSHGHHG